ncbi:MAG TPA: alpha/beta fold hydrolase [Puia sp.]|jgi:pimeloyl-ACP methyl ester carboxylesterase|nr:alpha/beta fold hydrolase [Puia sp.]
MEQQKRSGYAPVNGLQMYYEIGGVESEIGGVGSPLVYLTAGFGVAGVTRLTGLMDRRQVISTDLQGRGRTADIDRPLSFEQQAEDVIGLLDHLGIEKVDLLGECVGGNVAMLIAIRHPERVRRVVTYGSAFGPFGEAYTPEILAGTMELTSDSAVFEFQRTQYQRVAPDPAHWPVIWAKFGNTPWQGLSPEEMASVRAPVMIAVGDHDWLRLDKAIGYFRSIPGAELAVIPDAGHFVLDAEPDKLLPVVQAFLDKPEGKLPFATTAIPYLRGMSR